MITGIHVSSRVIQSIVKVTFDFCLGLTPKMIENRVLEKNSKDVPSSPVSAAGLDRR